MLPLFRTLLLGGGLAALALLAGFAAPEPPRPQLRMAMPANGPLIDSATHPEWKQFLIQAAYRRADELERLRDLPTYASLPAPAETPTEEVTGTIGDVPDAPLAVDIGESSSTELPLSESEATPPSQQPESLKRLNDSQPQPRKPRIAKRAAPRAKPPAKPAEEPGLFSQIFGSGTRR